nr:hypothetical protein [Tanacetum cinerariifolium]
MKPEIPDSQKLRLWCSSESKETSMKTSVFFNTRACMSLNRTEQAGSSFLLSMQTLPCNKKVTESMGLGSSVTHARRMKMTAV